MVEANSIRTVPLDELGRAFWGTHRTANPSRLAHPQVARADNPTEPFQPLAPSKHSAPQALKVRP